MKKLKIFTNHYYPENFRINDLSKEFSKCYDVSVITQIPNYPDGKFYAGYSLTKNKLKTTGEIEIKRLPVIPRGSNSFMLSLNYLSYIISSLFYRLFSKDKADHVFVYITSPIFISYAALAFAKKNKAKSTMYLLDLWPGALISILNVKNKFIFNILENAAAKLYKRFDNIIVSSYGFIEVLENYGVDRNKIHYIPQHSDEILAKPISIKPITDKLKIVFTGNIGEGQNLDVLIETAKILKRNNFFDVKFTLVGSGRYKTNLLNLVKDNKLEAYFEFVGRVDYNKIQGILSEHHFGFVSLKDDKILSKTLPAKVQSYMSFGIPILASADDETPLVINKSKSGICVPANDAKALAGKIIELRQISYEELMKMSKNGFSYCYNNFNLDEIVIDFMKIMKEGKEYV